MKSAFDPLVIGSLKAKNSIVRAATAESLAAASGQPTDELSGKYAELAAGGVGTIITGYAYVTLDGKPSEGALSIYDGTFAESYRALVELVHAHGAKLVLQLVYGGSKSKIADDDPRRFAPDAGAPDAGAPDSETSATDAPTNQAPSVSIVGPSAIENPKTHLVPRKATHDDLKRIAQAFGDAAARARDWGFDGVEIHAAHGYLLSQFLSRRFNVRSDEYGGALENRARLALECVRAARTATRPDFPILVKVNSCDDFDDAAGTQGGLSEDESAQVCAWLAEAGASAIDVSGDWHAVLGSDVTGAPFFAHFGARIARDLDVPVIVTGGWRRLDVVQAHLEKDGIDGIAMSRPFICEPGLVNRWLSGDETPSKCTSCNSCAKQRGIPCAIRQ